MGTAVVCKHFSARRAGVRNNLCTDTLPAVLVPPVLSALVGAEQPWTSLWGIGEFASAVLAARLTLSSSGGHTVPSAEGFDGSDRDAEGF